MPEWFSTRKASSIRLHAVLPERCDRLDGFGVLDQEPSVRWRTALNQRSDAFYVEAKGAVYPYREHMVDVGREEATRARRADLGANEDERGEPRA